MDNTEITSKLLAAKKAKKLILLDGRNSQKLLFPFWAIGDGHIGIWNLFQDIGESQQTIEVLDWYHLKENLYKVGETGRKVAKPVETFWQNVSTLLWQGKVDETQELFWAS